MQLTTQMQAEIEIIRKRLDHIDDILDNDLPQALQESSGFISEMTTYKVRLENILCDTDIKEQVHSYSMNLTNSPNRIFQPISDQNSYYLELGFVMN